jgi:hypothetical protein
LALCALRSELNVSRPEAALLPVWEREMLAAYALKRAGLDNDSLDAADAQKHDMSLEDYRLIMGDNARG